MREDFKTQKRAYDKSEDDLKALQSVGQIIGEVLRQLDDEKCTPPPRLSNWAHFAPKRQIFLCRSANPSFVVIVKASSGPRYVVGCRKRVEKKKLIAGTRVALDMTTLTIMRVRRPHRRRSRQSFSITARTKPHGRVVVHA